MKRCLVISLLESRLHKHESLPTVQSAQTTLTHSKRWRQNVGTVNALVTNRAFVQHHAQNVRAPMQARGELSSHQLKIAFHVFLKTASKHTVVVHSSVFPRLWPCRQWIMTQSQHSTIVTQYYLPSGSVPRPRTEVHYPINVTLQCGPQH